MSNINIRRAVENIRAITNVYTPVVELIVNAVEAINELGGAGGRVSIRALRDREMELDDTLPAITGFEIEDNGIGFTDEHRESFDTLYSDRKIAEGGKGFGRFVCLKYFEELRVRSVFQEGPAFKFRSFSMGKDNDIIVGEEVTDSKSENSGTVVRLANLKKNTPAFEKKLSTVARNLVQRLLPYFITQDYVCPEIVVSEKDGTDAIRLNDFVDNELATFIREIPVKKSTFCLTAINDTEDFAVRVFKIYSPGNQKSRISLVAHKREVSGSPLQKYVPEFEEEFYEKNGNGEVDRTRNYITKAYVFGRYLDSNVSLERG